MDVTKGRKPTCIALERRLVIATESKLPTAKYAAGLWKARGSGRWEVVTANGQVLVPCVVGTREDACLIAAAPEMYELLEESYNLMAHGDHGGFIRSIKTKVPDVLARAREDVTK